RRRQLSEDGAAGLGFRYRRRSRARRKGLRARRRYRTRRQSLPRPQRGKGPARNRRRRQSRGGSRRRSRRQLRPVRVGRLPHAHGVGLHSARFESSLGGGLLKMGGSYTVPTAPLRAYGMLEAREMLALG